MPILLNFKLLFTFKLSHTDPFSRKPESVQKTGQRPISVAILHLIVMAAPLLTFL